VDEDWPELKTGDGDNLRLLESPGFMHLTPRHIQRHCEVKKSKLNSSARLQSSSFSESDIRRKFRHAFANGAEPEAKKLLENLISKETVDNADLFLEELVRYKLKEQNFGAAFALWSSYALAERTISGADQLLEHVLNDHKDLPAFRQTRISEFLTGL
jgi:hypothetical protein